MSFNARDLAIQLSTGWKIEGLWAMACPACDSTGPQDPRPACQGTSEPCPSPSEADPSCAESSKKAEGYGERFPGGLALLRREMKDALGRAS
jgi:hypothetical protein